MITIQGDKMAARVASSLLKSVGLDELVCTNHSGTKNPYNSNNNK